MFHFRMRGVFLSKNMDSRQRINKKGPRSSQYVKMEFLPFVSTCFERFRSVNKSVKERYKRPWASKTGENKQKIGLPFKKFVRK